MGSSGALLLKSTITDADVATKKGFTLTVKRKMSPGVLGERNPIVWLFCVRNFSSSPVHSQATSVVKKALGLNDRASSSEHKSWADIWWRWIGWKRKGKWLSAPWARSRMYLSNSSLEWKVGMKRRLWVGWVWKLAAKGEPLLTSCLRMKV